jgi:signal transduction histidine kinase
VRTISESAARVSHRYGRDIDLRLDNLAACSEIFLDPGLFAVSLENVLANACEALPLEGCSHARHDVSIELAEPVNEGMTCAVKVVDNGEGIRDKIFPRVFHPFFTTKTGHVGMGLTFAKQIQEELGGEISIVSEFMKGTAVTLELSGDRRRSIRRRIRESA